MRLPPLLAPLLRLLFLPPRPRRSSRRLRRVRTPPEAIVHYRRQSDLYRKPFHPPLGEFVGFWCAAPAPEAGKRVSALGVRTVFRKQCQACVRKGEQPVQT